MPPITRATFQTRAETVPQPLRPQRLTPLAFAPPRTPIDCENTGIRTLPYFQTCTLSHACHVTELFKCELPVDWTLLPMRLAICNYIPQQYAAHCFPFRNLWTLLTMRLALCSCFPQYNCTHQNLTEKLCPQLHGPRSRPAPKPCRNRSAHSVSHH